MAWYPSRGVRLRGFPPFQQHHFRERIPSGTAPLVLSLPLPLSSKKRKVKGPSLLRLPHQLRFPPILPSFLPLLMSLLFLLQSCT